MSARGPYLGSDCVINPLPCRKGYFVLRILYRQLDRNVNGADMVRIWVLSYLYLFSSLGNQYE